ncbi:MAG: hypothetical protein ACTH31_12580 [Pseudoclavibacter sp.]
MTRRRIDLPDEFHHRPFAVARAAASGVRRGRLEGDDLRQPFRGARVPADWDLSTAEGVARAYAPLLRDGQALGGVSAAALWGLPLPDEFDRGARVQVIVRAGRSRPTGECVDARTVTADRWDIVTIDGIPVASPTLTLLTLARDLRVHDLAAVADALRADSDHYESIAHHVLPLSDASALEALAAGSSRVHGAATLREAIEFSRDGVESPLETLLRWALVKIGRLPEPLVNVEARAGRRKLGTPDLSYPAAKLGIEYEGDGHRTDRAQWGRDIRRVERFADAGWHLMRVSSADLFPDPSLMLARIARRLQGFDVPLGGFEWPERTPTE